MKVSALFTTVRYNNEDADGDVWNDTTLLAFYNNAIKTACQAKPSLCATVKALSLSAGSAQTLTSTDYRLSGILYNYVGDAVGKVMRGPVPMVDMDAMLPTWHTTTANDDHTIDEYIVNKETPRDFWVYPKASASSKIMATVAVLPTDATVPATDDVPDSILPIIGGITEYMLYCCWRGDDERSPTWAKGERARQSAFNILGIKIQAETEYAPKELEKQ